MISSWLISNGSCAIHLALKDMLISACEDRFWIVLCTQQRKLTCILHGPLSSLPSWYRKWYPSSSSWQYRKTCTRKLACLALLDCCGTSHRPNFHPSSCFRCASCSIRLDVAKSVLATQVALDLGSSFLTSRICHFFPGWRFFIAPFATGSQLFVRFLISIFSTFLGQLVRLLRLRPNARPSLVLFTNTPLMFRDLPREVPKRLPVFLSLVRATLSTIFSLHTDLACQPAQTVPNGTFQIVPWKIRHCSNVTSTS